MDRWEKLTGQPILEGYGLSETSPILTVNMKGKEKAGMVGFPVPNCTVRVVDDKGAPVE